VRLHQGKIFDGGGRRSSGRKGSRGEGKRRDRRTKEGEEPLICGQYVGKAQRDHLKGKEIRADGPETDCRKKGKKDCV